MIDNRCERQSISENAESMETFQNMSTYGTYTNVTSQTIITITLTQTIKNTKFGPRISKLNTMLMHVLIEILFAGLARRL